MKGSVWLSMAVLWAAYAAGYYGWVLVRGYNVSLAQVIDPVNYYKGGWPPAYYGGTGIFPSGNSGDNTGSSSGASGASGSSGGSFAGGFLGGATGTA